VSQTTAHYKILEKVGPRSYGQGLSCMIALALSLLLGQPLFAAERRIYITDNPTWTLHTTRRLSASIAEAMKRVKELKECRNFSLTIDEEKADHVFLLERDDKRDRVVVFDAQGDVIYASYKKNLKDALKDACKKMEAFQKLNLGQTQ